MAQFKRGASLRLVPMGLRPTEMHENPLDGSEATTWPRKECRQECPAWPPGKAALRDRSGVGFRRCRVRVGGTPPYGPPSARHPRTGPGDTMRANESRHLPGRRVRAGGPAKLPGAAE